MSDIVPSVDDLKVGDRVLVTASHHTYQNQIGKIVMTNLLDGSFFVKAEFDDNKPVWISVADIVPQPSDA